VRFGSLVRHAIRLDGERQRIAIHPVESALSWSPSTPKSGSLVPREIITALIEQPLLEILCALERPVGEVHDSDLLDRQHHVGDDTSIRQA
jgi:hypothetical protein